MKSFTRLSRSLAPPVIFGVGFLVAWELLVKLNDLPRITLPAPSRVWSQLFDNFGLVRDASGVTGMNAVIGLVCGVVLGAVIAIATNRFRLASELINPVAITIAAVPAVVIVSVLNNMYSLSSQTGRRVMVTLAVFFIIFVQVSKGLRQTNATQMELMRSYASTPRDTLRKVKAPNAVSFLFTGIRTAAPVAIIIALVSEYFGGTQDGLGSRIASAFSSSKKDLGLAYVVGASVVGLVFFAASNLLEYVAVPWQRQRASR